VKTSLALGAIVAVSVFVRAQNQQVIHLDVSVLDKDRQPIRGLTAADFT
jgi:hypothetical protein